MSAGLGILATLKHVIAVWLMIHALKLISRKDDARSLRIAIPLTLALVETMSVASSKTMEPLVGTFRDRLAAMRLKLARLEGTETTLA